MEFGKPQISVTAHLLADPSVKFNTIIKASRFLL